MKHSVFSEYELSLTCTAQCDDSFLGQPLYHPVVDADGIEDESQLIFYNEQEIDLIAATHQFMMDGNFRRIQSPPFEQLFIISAVI